MFFKHYVATWNYDTITWCAMDFLFLHNYPLITLFLKINIDQPTFEVTGTPNGTSGIIPLIPDIQSDAVSSNMPDVTVNKSTDHQCVTSTTNPR